MESAAIQTAPHCSAETGARPAAPRLASALIDSASLDAVFETLSCAPAVPANHPDADVLQMGVGSLDEALGSLVHSGRLVALSAETSSRRDDVAKALLADCLVRHTESLVAVVDTTGNFDVVGLYKQILTRLELEPGSAAEMGGPSCESERQRMEGVAARVLDRVKIMRVFDFVGMREAVGELRDGLEGKMTETETDAAHEHKQMLEETATAAKETVTAAEGSTEKVPSPLPKRTEIADSEDEDEGIEASDDEMLFDTPAPPPDPDVRPAGQAPAADATSAPVKPDQQPTPSCAPSPKLKLILIDNLSSVLTPLLKRDTVSAHALATTFLTTLRNLARTHALHTILLNPCTTPRAPTTGPNPASATPVPQQQAYAPQPPPSPSVFSSSAAVPALMGLMSRYADAHVLVSVLPRRKMDAKVYYGDAGGREREKRRGVEMVGVLEVVADRWGGRVGAWGTFGEGRGG